MSMARKHYREAAQILHSALPSDPEVTSYSVGDVGDIIERMANQFAAMFKQDNRAFDRERFMDAVFDK
jgi:hypothetical protein